MKTTTDLGWFNANARELGTALLVSESIKAGNGQEVNSWVKDLNAGYIDGRPGILQMSAITTLALQVKTGNATPEVNLAVLNAGKMFYEQSKDMVESGAVSNLQMAVWAELDITDEAFATVIPSVVRHVRYLDSL
jgi:hypothetical protein